MPRRLFGREDWGEHRLQVSVDYHQFRVADAETADDEDPWPTDESVRDMLWAGRHALHVLTVRNDDVPLELVLAQEEPRVDLAEWQHAVEASLALPSGRLSVGFHEPRRFRLPRGTYRALVLGRGLDTVSDDDLSGDDGYRVALWPGEPRPLAVLKRFDIGYPPATMPP